MRTSGDTAAPWPREARDRIDELLTAAGDLAFFFDFDGTLVDACCVPDDVAVPDWLADLLETLNAANNGAVAVLSGRRMDDLDARLAPLRLPGCGQHGAEQRLTDRGMVTRLEAADFAPVRDYLDAQQPLLGGLAADDRGLSIAIHCCDGPRWAGYARFLAEEACRLAPGCFEVKPGRLTAEITPEGASKGAVLMRLMATKAFRGRLPVVFGDDETDEGAFLSAQSLGGFAFQVGDRREHRADIALKGPADVHWLIREFSLRPAALQSVG